MSASTRTGDTATTSASLAEREAAASDRLATVLGWCFGVAMAAVLFCVIAYVRAFGWHLSSSREVWNQAGGFFGGVLGPTFGMLSLFALLFTVMLQREQLSLGRTQLADSRVELALSRYAYERQQFESTFFELLKLTRELQERFFIARTETSDEIAGARALDAYAAGIYKRTGDESSPSTTDTARQMVRIFNGYYRSHPSAFGPYFRSMYQTFQHIDDSRLNDDDKRSFANIARGQISEGAVFLLALNGLTELGFNFIRYIEAFGLLEHMHRRYLGTYKDALLVGYHNQAFMGSKQRQAALSTASPKQRPDFFVREIQEPIAAGGYPANPDLES